MSEREGEIAVQKVYVCPDDGRVNHYPLDTPDSQVRCNICGNEPETSGSRPGEEAGSLKWEDHRPESGTWSQEALYQHLADGRGLVRRLRKQVETLKKLEDRLP